MEWCMLPAEDIMIAFECVLKTKNKNQNKKQNKKNKKKKRKTYWEFLFSENFLWDKDFPKKFRTCDRLAIFEDPVK